MDTTPLTKVSDKEFIEGYWWSKEYPNYPKPVSTKLPVDTLFLSKLKDITVKIESNMLQGGSYQHYRGFSICRVCNFNCNGAKEYKFIINDVTYRYPEGLLHYYEKHNVQPSKEFYDVIMKL